ncbi:hypothetical protein GJ496_002294 [Pomphorhynchus laevis]|nr:hypothetical protein GJ496_002294 [Pomphorhynchus laevis]
MSRRSKYYPPHNDGREATFSFRHLAPASTSSVLCFDNDKRTETTTRVDNSNLNKDNYDETNKYNNLTNNDIFITSKNGTERD